eukprot:comp21788_c0_seq1/m.48884 comp21788_c0_seq1/g.48884  ORF comp21788_c0_seq1/g.48884 comp21788_c0_seq1/m.48884 type:complete len:353 (-) comp21788_c0_seq1:538-1596(-)
MRDIGVAFQQRLELELELAVLDFMDEINGNLADGNRVWDRQLRLRSRGRARRELHFLFERSGHARGLGGGALLLLFEIQQSAASGIDVGSMRPEQPRGLVVESSNGALKHGERPTDIEIDSLIHGSCNSAKLGHGDCGMTDKQLDNRGLFVRVCDLQRTPAVRGEHVHVKCHAIVLKELIQISLDHTDVSLFGRKMQHGSVLGMHDVRTDRRCAQQAIDKLLVSAHERNVGSRVPGRVHRVDRVVEIEIVLDKLVPKMGFPCALNQQCHLAWIRVLTVLEPFDPGLVWLLVAQCKLGGKPATQESTDAGLDLDEHAGRESEQNIVAELLGVVGDSEFAASRFFAHKVIVAGL